MSELGAAWLDGYIDAWLGHVVAGGPDGAPALAELLGYFTAEVNYEDVPSGAEFVGHAGVAEMARQAYGLSTDLTFEIVTCQTDGRSFAFETRGARRHVLVPDVRGEVLEQIGQGKGAVGPSGHDVTQPRVDVPVQPRCTDLAHGRTVTRPDLPAAVVASLGR